MCCVWPGRLNRSGTLPATPDQPLLEQPRVPVAPSGLQTEADAGELRATMLQQEAEIARLRARLREREAAALALSLPPTGVHVADGAAGLQGPEHEGLQELHDRLAAAGIQLPRGSRGGSSYFGRCKTLESLQWELQERLSQLSFDGGGVMRHVELVKVLVTAEVHGKRRCLYEQDRFILNTGAQRVVMLPLRRKIRHGETWRDAMRTALTDKVGLSPSWQDQYLHVREDTYKFYQLDDMISDYPHIPTLQRVHEVQVYVDAAKAVANDALQAGSASNEGSALEHIGLPEGHDFVWREVCSDSIVKLHVWVWKNREHEETVHVDTFEQYLKDHGVDVSQFGTGSKKSLYHLYTEVKELNESSLEEVPNDAEDGAGVSLLRVTEILSIKLIVEVQNRSMVLTTAEQFLDDGRRRKLKQFLVVKLREGETQREAANRAFQEKLGLSLDGQQSCFRSIDGPEEYEEQTSWSKGYPLRTLYKVHTWRLMIPDPDDPMLVAIGLPRATDFVTQEGQLGHNQRGRLYVWTWKPHRVNDGRAFVGTAYEDFCRTLQDAENLVAQTAEHPQIGALGLMAPLTQSLEKIQSCLDRVAYMDNIMAEVDVAGMMRMDEKAERSEDLAKFISSNYTRRRAIVPQLETSTPDDASDRVPCRSSLERNMSPTSNIVGRPQCMLGLIDGQDNWGFDFFQLAEQCRGTLLQSYGEVTLARLCQHALRCNRDAVCQFLETVASMYNKNPYHNDLHAVQVCHTATWLADFTGLASCQTLLDRASFRLAALCHDVKHFGRTNTFCIETQHLLSLTYNDISVLENMHAATCYAMLQGTASTSGTRGANMLAMLDSSERKGLRSQIIEYILSTDMSEHFEVITKFRLRREAVDFSAANEPDRRFIARLCMKAGDISHSALPWDLHEHYSILANQEFLEQGDEERRLGLPVSPLCDRQSISELGKSQRGFLDFVCMPLFKELSSYEVIGKVTATQGSAKRLSTWPRPHEGVAFSPPADDSVITKVARRKTFRVARLGQLQREAAVERTCCAQIRTNAQRWVEDHAAVARVMAALSADAAAAP